MTDLSIIIVACNVADLVDQCLSKVQASEDDLAKEVLFVDNGSTDGTAELVREKYPEVTVIRSEANLGFIRANNLAYQKATGRHILMLNSDAFIGPKTLQRTVEFMDAHPEYGALGCRLIGRDGELQPSARNFPTPWRTFVTRLGLDRRFLRFRGIDDLDQDMDKIRDCDWVPGCYLLTRKSAVDKLGFFLREDFFMYNDDNDLCFRLKQGGWKACYFPEDVIHLGGENNKKLGKVNHGMQVHEYAVESGYIYFRKNYGLPSVLSAFFFDALFHSVQLGKQILLFKKSLNARRHWEELISESRILIRTRFGNRAIH